MLPVENLILDSTTAILSALENIGAAHNAARASIYAFTAHPGPGLTRQALWTRTPRTTPAPARLAIDLALANPAAYRNLQRNIPLAGLRRDHPDWGPLLDEKALGFAIVPLMIQGDLWGIICCEYDEEQTLTAALVSSLLESAVKIAASLLRKQNIECIRAENEEYRFFLEHANDLVARVDEDFIIRAIYGNRTRLDGFSADGVLDHSIFEFLHPDEAPRLIEALDRIKAGRFIAEYRPRTNVRDIGWVRVSSYPVYEQGLYKGLWCVVTDITAQKHAGEVLEDSTRQYRLLVDNLPQGVFTLDRDLNLISVSPVCARLWGAPSATLEHLQKLPIVMRIIETLRPDFPSGDALTTAAPLRRPIEMAMPDGSPRYLEVEAATLYDEHATRIGVIGSVRDTTQEYCQTQAMKASEARQRYLLENIQDVLLCYDLEGNITYASDNIMAMSGYTPAEIVALPVTELVPPDFLAQMTDNLAKLHRGEAGISEYRMRHRDGSYHWVRLNCQPIWEQGHIREVVGVIIEIDRYKAIEQQYQVSEKAENIYQQIIEQMPSLVWVTDARLITTYISPSVEPILGYSVAQAKGMELGVILKRDAFKQMVEAFDEALSAAKAPDRAWFKDIMIWMKRANGRIIKGTLRLSLLFDGATHVGYLGITTFRKKAPSLRGGVRPDRG